MSIYSALPSSSTEHGTALFSRLFTFQKYVYLVIFFGTQTMSAYSCTPPHTRVGTLIVATIYLQLMQNRYMFQSFTVLQCSHQLKPL